jgi:hypothetical protein
MFLQDMFEFETPKMPITGKVCVIALEGRTARRFRRSNFDLSVSGRRLDECNFEFAAKTPSVTSL